MTDRSPLRAIAPYAALSVTAAAITVLSKALDDADPRGWPLVFLAVTTWIAAVAILFAAYRLGRADERLDTAQRQWTALVEQTLR